MSLKKYLIKKLGGYTCDEFEEALLLGTKQQKPQKKTKVITKKVCSRCKRMKYIEAFHRNRLSSDGHESQCKQCKSEQYRQRKKQFKTCVRCNQEKLLNEFNNNKKAIDNKQSWCRQCQKEYNEQYNQKFYVN